MSGIGNENIFEGLDVKPACLHRALQLCKEQNETFVQYVCGKCSTKFKAEEIVAALPAPKDPIFPKHSIPWGLRSRQA